MALRETNYTKPHEEGTKQHEKYQRGQIARAVSEARPRAHPTTKSNDHAFTWRFAFSVGFEIFGRFQKQNSAKRYIFGRFRLCHGCKNILVELIGQI